MNFLLNRYSRTCIFHNDILLLTRKLFKPEFQVMEMTLTLFKLYRRHHELVNSYWTAVSQMIAAMFLMSKLKSRPLSPNVTKWKRLITGFISNNTSNTTVATYGAVSTYPSWVPVITPICCWVRCFVYNFLCFVYYCLLVVFFLFRCQLFLT